MKRMLWILLLWLLALPLAAQVSLTVTKSGSDVVLTWTGGTGPYEVIRSSSPTMTARTATVASGATSPVSDTGGMTRGAFIEYYQVSDSTAPTVAITTPADAFSSSLPCVCATGTASADAVVVYVNGATATGTTSWSSCADTTGVPLAVQSDARLSGAGVAVIAAAADADGNWVFDLAPGTYTGTITERAACAERATGM